MWEFGAESSAEVEDLPSSWWTTELSVLGGWPTPAPNAHAASLEVSVQVAGGRARPGRGKGCGGPRHQLSRQGPVRPTSRQHWPSPLAKLGCLVSLDVGGVC